MQNEKKKYKQNCPNIGSGLNNNRKIPASIEHVILIKMHFVLLKDYFIIRKMENGNETNAGSIYHVK